MPLPLIAVILAVAGTLAVVVVAILYYEEIIKWFRSRNDIKEADKANIAFTIKQRLNSGDYKIVQGIFNKRNETILDGHVIQAKELDKDLADAHEGKELVLYE